MTWSKPVVDWVNAYYGPGARWEMFDPTGPTPTALIDVSKPHSCSWHAYATPHTGGWFETNKYGWWDGRMFDWWDEWRPTGFYGGSTTFPNGSGWQPGPARDSVELQIIDGSIDMDVARWPRYKATLTVADPGRGNRELVSPYGTAIRFEWRNNYSSPGSVKWEYVCAEQYPGGPVVWSAWWMPVMQIVKSTYNGDDGTFRLECEDLTGIMQRMVWPRSDLTWKDFSKKPDALKPQGLETLADCFYAISSLYSDGGYNTEYWTMEDVDANIWYDRKAIEPNDPIPGNNVMETLDAVASMAGHDVALVQGHGWATKTSEPDAYWHMWGLADPHATTYTFSQVPELNTIAVVPNVDQFPGTDVQYDLSVTQNVTGWDRIQTLRPNEWWNSYTLKSDGSDDKTRVGVGRVTGGPSQIRKVGRVVVRDQVDSTAFTDANLWTRAQRDEAAKRNLRRARKQWVVDGIGAVPDPGLRDGMRVKFRHSTGETRRGYVRKLNYDLTGQRPMTVGVGSDLQDDPDVFATTATAGPVVAFTGTPPTPVKNTDRYHSNPGAGHGHAGGHP